MRSVASPLPSCFLEGTSLSGSPSDRHVSAVVEHRDLGCDDALLQVVSEIATSAAELEILRDRDSCLVLGVAIARCRSGALGVRFDEDAPVELGELSNRGRRRERGVRRVGRTAILSHLPTDGRCSHCSANGRNSH